jgi:hypothetical protein
MICGNLSLDADSFFTFFNALNEHGLFTYIFPPDVDIPEPNRASVAATAINGRIGWLMAAREDFRTKGVGEDLVMLLNRDYVNNASDPRDYVYSLFGIAKDGSHPDHRPNYLLDVSQVYIKTCRYHIKTTGFARFLYEAGPPYQIEGLPSWAPDWSTAKGYYSLFWNARDGRPIYNAGHGVPPAWQFSSDSRTLIGRGVFIDVVEDVGSAIRSNRQDPLDFDKTAQLFLETENMVCRSAITTEGRPMTRAHFDLLTL